MTEIGFIIATYMIALDEMRKCVIPMRLIAVQTGRAAPKP